MAVVISADRRHRPGHGVEVVLVECGHADAAGVQAVDAEFAAQALHLCGAQPGVAEHALLRGDEAEVMQFIAEDNPRVLFPRLPAA